MSERTVLSEALGKVLTSAVKTLGNNANHKAIEAAVESALAQSKQAAFEQGQRLGYANGYHDGMVVVGSLIAVCSLLFVFTVARVYKNIREALRPVSTRWVQQGVSTVLAVQKYHSPFGDLYCKVISWTVGVEFYATFLPFLFWCGENRLARSLTLFMALCIYVGNAVKDIVCAPRPPSPPVVRSKGAHSLEYGMPSTHALNASALACFVLHFYHTRGTLSPTDMSLLVGVLVVWLASVIFGRLYLGMHSPMDIVVGVVMGSVLLLFWILIEESIDAWVTEGTGVILFQLCMSIMLLNTYPIPPDVNPSFYYAVYFTGTTFGVISGSHYVFDRFHSPAAEAAVQQQRTAVFLVKRFVVGMIVVLVSKESVEAVVKLVAKPLCHSLRIPFSEHNHPTEELQQEALKQKKKSDNSERKETTSFAINIPTARRFLGYTAVGYAVCHPAMIVFEMLGI